MLLFIRNVLRANPVDDGASRFGEVLLAYPLPLLASLSLPDEERSQDSVLSMV